MVQFPAVPRGRDPILACFWPFGNYFDLKNEFFGHGYHMAGLRRPYFSHFGHFQSFGCRLGGEIGEIRKLNFFGQIHILHEIWDLINPSESSFGRNLSEKSHFLGVLPSWEPFIWSNLSYL